MLEAVLDAYVPGEAVVSGIAVERQLPPVSLQDRQKQFRPPVLRAEDIGAVLLVRGHLSDQAIYPKPHVGGPGIEKDLPILTLKPLMVRLTSSVTSSARTCPVTAMRLCLFGGVASTATEYSVSFLSQYSKVDIFIPFIPQSAAIDRLETC